MNKTETLDEFKKQNPEVIVDFWADWCGPCKKVEPELEKISEETGIPIYKINVDENSELSIKYQIMSIPAILYFKDGELSARTTGAAPAEVIKQNLGIA